MDSQASAQKAITMFKDYVMNDRPLTVNFARPREERGSGGGFQRGNRNQQRGGGQRRY
jgi:RNA recognition motif-containing protein